MIRSRLLAATLLLPALLFDQKPPKDYTKGFGTGFNLFSEHDERALGMKYSEELDRRLRFLPATDVGRYVDGVARRVVAVSARPDLPMQVRVVDTREVNAFAVPGGFLYVNRGLIDLADSEAQLAGVLAHEIAHVEGRHGTRQMSKQLLLLGAVAGASAAAGSKSRKWGEVAAAAGGIGVLLANLRYSRQDERQADAMAARWMASAGYDPDALIAFFRKMDNSSAPGRLGRALALLNTHPPTADRVRDLTVQIASLERGEFGAPQTRAFEGCKARLAALPHPPAGKEVTLSHALAAAGLAHGEATSLEPIGTREQAGAPIDIPASAVWIDTAIRVRQGQAVEVWAEGEIFVKKGNELSCDPSGVFGSGRGWLKPVSSLNTGALIGRVRGQAGSQPFAIGTHRVFRAPAAGTLELGINDDNNFDNRGAFRAWILTR
jgi:Zn-dependent protease with chaperone function